MYMRTMPLFIVMCLKTSRYWLPNPPASLSLAGDSIEDGGHLRGLLFSWVTSQEIYTIIYTNNIYTNNLYKSILIIRHLFVFLLLSLITGTLSQKPGRIQRFFFSYMVLTKSLNTPQRQLQTGQSHPVSFRLPLT